MCSVCYIDKYVYKLYNIYEMYIYVYTHSVYNFIVMLQNFILRNTIRILFMFYLLWVGLYCVICIVYMYW